MRDRFTAGMDAAVLRRAGFAATIVTGLAMLAAALHGMTGVDSTLRLAAAAPPGGTTFVVDTRGPREHAPDAGGVAELRGRPPARPPDLSHADGEDAAGGDGRCSVPSTGPEERSGMPRALVVIDIQKDYFPGGRMELVGAEDASRRARALLDAFRSSGEPLFHVQHLFEGDDAPFFAPGTEGAEIHPEVAPTEGERVIVKHHPNAFKDTPLKEEDSATWASTRWCSAG